MPTNNRNYPYADSALARFISQRVDELRPWKSQRQIAVAAGLPNSSAFSMLKRGEMNPPLARLPAVARALETDPIHLLRLGLLDIWPELAYVIDEALGRHLATYNEYRIFLAKWRKASGDSDPAPNARIEAAIDAMLIEAFGAPRT